MEARSRSLLGIVSALCALLLSLVVATPALATTYSDVNYSNYYGNGITYCSDRGIITGYPNGTFGPDRTMTRAQLATIMWRLAKPSDASNYRNVQSSTVNTTGKSDVASRDWYTGAANWAVANGVINGYPDGRFDPNGPVSAEMFVTVVANFADKAGAAAADTSKAETYFSDASTISPWALGSAVWARDKGVLSGSPDGHGGKALLPSSQITRGRCAAIITNACQSGVIKPVTIVQPQKPAQPSKPSQPAQPSKPATPSKPSTPSQPSKPSQPTTPSGQTQTVYVTKSGKRFHRAGCPATKGKKVTALTRSDAIRRGYTACKDCRP